MKRILSQADPAVLKHGIQDVQVIVSANDETDVAFTLIDGNLCEDQIGMVFGSEKEEADLN